MRMPPSPLVLLLPLALSMCAVVATPSCTTDRPEVELASEMPATAMAKARDELATLRSRFPSLASTLLRAPALDGTSRAKLAMPVRVELPASSLGDTVIEEASGLSVRIRLEGRPRASRVEVDGLALYPGAGIVQRAHDHGAEDLVSFETRPSVEEAVYTITPSGAAGLRLVAGSLELLDASGTPRLRMDAPYLVDAVGTRIDTSVALEGCAFDASPVAPWGRRVTAPLASRCTLRLAWRGRHAVYPALLDPSWSTTGSSAARAKQSVVKLANGLVLAFYGESCGGGCFPFATAFLYDPATKSWANTGSPSAKATDVPAVLLGNGKVLALTPDGTQLYDPATGLFSFGGVQVVQRGGVLTRLASGKVLASGGGGTSGSAEIYDPGTNTFTGTPVMKAAHAGHAAALLTSGKVLVVGGGTASAELYDPIANTFTLTGSMSIARESFDAIRLASGKVLVVGDAPQAELYDPATGVFTKTGSLAFTRTHTAAALMPSGNVYVAGGYIGSAATTLVERYDLATGVFSPAPTMVKPRGDLRLTLLDTSVLFATGGNIDTSGTASQDGGEELSVVLAGGVCAIGDDCASGTCDLGICCASTCTSRCMSCVAGTGACVAVKGADDPSSCTGTSTCDAAGACKSKRGRACMADTECATGFCTDGVCCDRACKGACEACDGAAAGICETVAGKPHGARTCATDGSTCGGACDGRQPTICAFPGVQTGCGTSCADGVRTAGACDGKGTCASQAARPCPGNYACADANSCRFTCATNAECAHGYGCTNARCIPIAACDGQHTIVGADGKSKTDCTPFRCNDDTNTCETSCQDVAGCVEPFLCDMGGQCVAPPSAPAGCAITPREMGNSADLGGLGAALVGLLAARRRRLRWIVR